MREQGKNRIQRLVVMALGLIMPAFVLLSSCERIYEDLDPCPHGVALRFVYDYNMAYANAFPRQVDCLTLLVYDSTGRYVDTRTVTGPELQDEAYRLHLELTPGTYRFVAYGGLACEESSFVFGRPQPGKGVRVEETMVAMKADLSLPVKEKLHGMYYGSLTLETADLFRAGTMEMMKNTNNIRIVLQQMNGEAVRADDFEFAITDDNTLFAWDNDLVSHGTVTYAPWVQGQASMGMTAEGQEVVAAYAEFSTSRLMTKNSPRLLVRRASDGGDVIDILLNNCLLLLKSDLYAQMGAQEFLDRESEWSLVFFLDENGAWISTYIKINDWMVRINDMEM